MYYWLIFIAVAVISQILKFIIYWIKDKKPDFRKLVEPGGMPSAHTSSFVALTTAIGIGEGVGSSAFSISLCLTLFIMYEAGGLRRAAGRQAEILNKIVQMLFKEHKFPYVPLREIWGHTPLEILCGAFLGVSLGFLFSYIF